MVQVALVVLTRADLLIDLVSDLGVALRLLFDQLKDVQLLEALSRLELLDNLATLLIGIAVSAWSDKKNGWFDACAELGEGLVEVLLGADLLHVRSRLKVWHQARGVLIKLSDALGENSRWLVRAVCLSQGSHALLAQVLGALEGKHAGRRHAVFDEEFGLEFALGEVFEKHARGCFHREHGDQSHGLLLVIAVSQALLVHELVVVHEFHISALAECCAQFGFSGGLWADDAGDLRKHGFPCVLVDVNGITVSINFSHFAELLVVGYDWKILGIEGFKTLLDGISVVISATLTALHEALDAGFLRAVEEEDALGLEDVGLKIRALINFSGESINQIVLISNTENESECQQSQQLLILNFRPLLTVEGVSIKALIKSCTVSSSGAFLP